MCGTFYAIWRRMVVFDWPVKFVPFPQPDNPFEKLKDPNLENNFKEWAPYLAGMMVMWLDWYRLEGLVEPPSILKHTKEYLEDNSDYAEYVKTNYKYTGENTDRVTWDDIKTHASQTFKNLVTPGKTKQAIGDLKDAFRLVYGVELATHRIDSVPISAYKKLQRRKCKEV